MSNHEQETKTKPSEGSFVRWQATTISQLGFATNLFLGFSVAVLGFEITLLLNGTFDFGSCLPKCGFLLSLLMIVLSICLGIGVVINRLRDFRATMHAARLRESTRADELAECAHYRALAVNLGKWTWCLFWWQIGTFSVGLILFFLSIVLPSASKLI